MAVTIAYLPQTLTSTHVQHLLGVGRARLSQLRADPAFPAPIDGSSPRKPLWDRPEMLRYMVEHQGLSPDDLDGLDTHDGPATQRWRYTDSPAKPLTVTLSEHQKPQRYVAWLYDHVRDHSRKLVLMTGVNRFGTAFPLDMVHPAVMQTIEDVFSRWPLGDRITIALIDQWNYLWWADVNRRYADTDQPAIRMRRALDTESAALLLGHPIPHWDQEVLTTETALMWRPTNDGSVPEPVDVAPIGPLAEPAQLLNGVRDFFADPDALAQLPEPLHQQMAAIGAAGWDSTVSTLDDASPREARVRQGRVNAQRRPLYLDEMAPPPFPTPSRPFVWSDALSWLIQQPEHTHLAKAATTYLGFEGSLGVSRIDEAVAGPDLWARLLRSVDAPIEATGAWVQQCLLRESGIYASNPYLRWARWVDDVDGGGERPVLIYQSDGTAPSGRIWFHVPRTSTPLAAGSSITLLRSDDHVAALAVSGSGTVHPLPCPRRIHDVDSGRVAEAITGLAIGLARPIHYGGTTRIHPADKRIEAVAGALADIPEPLTLTWEVLQEAARSLPTDREYPDNDQFDRDKALSTAYNATHHRR